MKGYIFTGDRRVGELQKETPVPQKGEVLIRTRATAICGSDLHYFRQPSEVRAPSARFFSGHEAAGVVESVGSHVSGYARHDRVVVYHVGGCGRCQQCVARRFKDCTDAQDHVFSRSRDGANADFVVVPEAQVLPLPDDFTFEEGSVMACTFGTAWAALQRTGVQPEDVIVVWGLGPIGLNLVLIARAMGIRVLGVDVSAGRRRVAEDLGCEAIDGTEPDVVTVLRTMTRGQGPDAIVETTGVPAVHSLAVATIRRTGTVVLVGLGQESQIGPVRELVLKEIAVKGSWIFQIEDWQPMMDFIRKNDVDVLSAVDRVEPIELFEESVHDADSATVAKIVFRWPATAEPVVNL